MGNDVWIVRHEMSYIRRDYEFFEWLLLNFTDCSDHGYIGITEFEEAVKKETPEFRKKFKDVINDVRNQFKLEKKKLPEPQRKWFDGFSFSVG